MRLSKLLYKLVITVLFVTYSVCGESVQDENKGNGIICIKCMCENSIINCTDVKLGTFFSTSEWAGIKDKNAEKVVMAYNYFEEVTQFSQLNLHLLDLSHGHISKIQDSAFRDLQMMQMLDLSYNNISSEALTPNVFKGKYEPEKFEPLDALRVLNLSYNNLHSLNQDLFEHTTEIEELRLSGNPFTVIDHVTVVAISSLSNLKILDLSNCMLKALPEYFLHTPRLLEWLDISINQLNKIPPSLEETKSLKFLNISNNPIKLIERNSTVYTPFYNLPNLVELHMSNMPKLEEIRSKSMSGLSNLKILHISNNSALTRIAADAFESPDPEGEGLTWPILDELYLNKNNISVIDSGLIARWDLLKHIDIRHNPYLCDCSTQWMVNTLAPIVWRTSTNMASDIICHEPIEMRGKSFIHLEEIHSHMRCVDKYGNHPEKDGLLLVGTLIGVLITVPVLLGLMFLYKRGCLNIWGDSGPAAFSRQFYKRTDTNDFL